MLSGDAPASQFRTEPETEEPVPVAGVAPALVPAAARYDLLDLLGRGGMGEVYKARDCELQRFVAVKFLRSDHEGAKQRFLQEARAQGRIDHENICKVYEVGELAGRPYIAMELVHGLPLHRVMSQLRVDEKLSILRDTAEALHAAHRLGIIHRDVKPSNLLIQRREDGSWRPVLMDFGLAHDVEAEYHLTRTGAVMGTPSYMAPEQARGDTNNIDRPTDVYSLGATLFDLLTSRPPFVGDSPAEVLLKVVAEDPPSVRTLQPELPVDLEIIVHKCLHKDPAQRYQSARALAEDLSRHLRGEPILGRRTSLLYRLRSQARKHRAVAAVAFLAMIGLSALGAYGIRARLQVQREQASAAARAKLSQELGQTIKEMEWFIRSVRQMPLHDTRYALAILQARTAKLHALQHGLGNAGDGLVQYALGHAYFALQDFERAYEHLAAAQRTGHDTPELRGMLGRVLGEQYRAKLEEAVRTGDVGFVRVRKKELREKYISPAVVFLRDSQSAELASPQLLAGLIALYGEQYDDALAKAAAATQQAPWLYEAKQLAGDVYFARGIDERSGPRFEEAKQSFDRAIGKYKEGAEIGRSDVRLYETIAESYLQWADIAVNLQGDHSKLDLLEQANNYCRRAIGIAPGRVHCHAKIARSYALILNAKTLQRIRLGSEFQELLDIAQNGLSIDHNHADLYDSIANGYASLALEEDVDDSNERYQKLINHTDLAIKYFRQALSLQPRSPIYLTNLGVTYLNKALNIFSREGILPQTELNLAISNHKAAAAIDPNYVAAWTDLLSDYTALIQEMSLLGQDPAAVVQSMRDDVHRYLTNIKDEYSIIGVAMAYHVSFRYPLWKYDKTAVIESFLRQRDISARLKITLPIGGKSFTFISLYQAVDEARTRLFLGQDPSAAIAAGRAVLSGCGGSLPPYYQAECLRLASMLAMLSADFAEQRGLSGLSSVRQAVADARQAVSILSAEIENPAQLARALLRLSQAQPYSPALVAEGLAACKTVCDGQGYSEGFALRGSLRLLQARAAASPKERRALAQQAQNDLALAVKKNPLLARVYEKPIAQVQALLGTPASP